MLKKLFKSLRSPQRRPKQLRATPEVLSHRQHPVQRNHISRNAIHVVERLQQAGYQAYLVGGCVRDLLLGATPKDFDVATNATPEQVRGEFRMARIIGRRFRLVHVRFGREIIEVATFRANHLQGEDDEHSLQTIQHESGRILRDNVYGTLEDDAQRRDFTINALYYDPRQEHILDYASGVRDINDRLIRLIGNPSQRYQEDPVRMLRAVRFAAKLDFTIEKNTEKPIRQLSGMLRDIPAARLFDEVLKLFLSGQALRTFELLLEYELFQPLFPATGEALKNDTGYILTLIRQALINTDERLAAGKSVTPAFLLAALLWPALSARTAQLRARGTPPAPALQEAAHTILAEQCQHIAIPRRFTLPIREIWEMQERLPRRHGKRAEQLREHPRFRAGYDFLLLREIAGERMDGLGDWWTRYQQVDERERLDMVRNLKNSSDTTRAPRKRRSRKRHQPNTAGTQDI